MTTQNQSAKFTSGSLMRHVAVMSFTGSIGLMAIFLVDFVDLIFIGMLGNVALAAAVGYAGTLLFFISSISIGLSIAAGVLVAKALGANDLEKARESATNVAIIGIALTSVLTVILFFFLTPALELIGASGETLELAKRFMWILLPSAPFMTLGFMGNALLRAYGDARRAMYATLFGGIVNAILDPIFIFGFDWGLQGAAIASVISRLVLCYFSIWPVYKVYQGFQKVDLKDTAAQLGEINSLAVPAVLTNIATPVGTGIFTRAMAEFGDSAVAASAVVSRLTPVAFAVVFALSGAIGPIIGQNAGAGQMDRVRKAYREAVVFSSVYVIIVSVILYFSRGFIADLFDAQGEARELIYLFCGPLSLGYIFMALIFVSNACFNNLGHPFYSTWINWGRNTIGIAPLVYVGAAYWGAKGVMIGQMAGAVIFAIIAYGLSLRLMNSQIKTQGDTQFAADMRDHTVANRRR